MHLSKGLGSMVLAATTLAGAQAADPSAPEAGFHPRFDQEFSVGGISRVGQRDPGLVGGGNGGTGKSVNFDDGNLNYGRGLASLAVQGRTTVSGSTERMEVGLEAVYFYDFINADHQTDFHDLNDEARERVARGLYLNDAFLGVKLDFDETRMNVRLGNQRLRWSESPAFGQSIAPVNPVAASRRYQPGNTTKDLVVALPMLSAEVVTPKKWVFTGFVLFGFEPTEPEAAGTFLSANDYYSPGSKYLQLGEGSPAVPDEDASVVTPATPFGSRVSRGPDRMPSSAGQFGLRVETPEMGMTETTLAAYAMRVHAREPIVSVHTGTLAGLLAGDYTSSGNYYLEYPQDVNIAGTSLRMKPAQYTQLRADYSRRFDQPLQIDDQLLITAGLAPAAAIATCVPVTPLCAGTLAALNANPLIAARGGITPANASRFFDTELAGYERFDVSQWAVSVIQGLPSIAGASKWYASAEAGGLFIHGFKPEFLDASVTVRPDEDGDARNGFASRSAWGYRLYTRMEFADVAGLKMLAPSLTWIQDVHGNAPITLGTLLEGARSGIAAIEAGFDDRLTARLSWRAWFDKGSNADRYSDRDFIAFSVTRKF